MYKRGILKKSEGLYNKGEFEKAMNTLAEGFNIVSLKNKMKPGWNKKQLEREAKEKAERERREKEEKERRDLYGGRKGS